MWHETLAFPSWFRTTEASKRTVKLILGTVVSKDKMWFDLSKLIAHHIKIYLLDMLLLPFRLVIIWTLDL